MIHVSNTQGCSRPPAKLGFMSVSRFVPIRISHNLYCFGYSRISCLTKSGPLGHALMLCLVSMAFPIVCPSVHAVLANCAHQHVCCKCEMGACPTSAYGEYKEKQGSACIS